MRRKHFRRQMGLVLAILIAVVGIFFTQENPSASYVPMSEGTLKDYFGEQTALEALESLQVKGRAAKTGYQRAQFGDGWLSQDGCDMRNIILSRDMADARVNEQCKVMSGTLNDPYTGEVILFERGSTSSQAVQIDHVVALSDAWQKGAQALDKDRRVKFSNDPLNLLAVSGPANQAKSNGDAATWLPANRPFRCQYVARQVAVKKKYHLWVTDAEKHAIKKILQACSN